MNNYVAHVRGKDTQSLEQHLLGVSEISKHHAGKLGLATQAELIGLVHDLGKYSADFQRYIKSATGLLNQDVDADYVDATGLRGTIDHSSAGAQYIWQSLSAKGQPGSIVGQILGLCVASHHSGLIDCLTSGPNQPAEDTFTKRMNKLDARTHLREALGNADASILANARDLLAKPELIGGISSWLRNIVLASPGKDARSIVAQQQIGLLVRMLFSCLIDADRIDTADYENPSQARERLAGDYVRWEALVGRLEAHLSSLSPKHRIDHLRQDISRHCLEGAVRSKGTYTLTVPTGGGKTLASLRFALHHASKYNMDRVIYVIPFTSIIDQNANIVRGILETEGVAPESVVLEHHSNLTPEEQTWRGKILSENWDAPVIYTTSVQFLEALFGSGTRGARRMHRLANSVLVFDEIQSLPINCVHMFNNAINFLVDHCGSTVVLCTATQPLLDKVEATKGAIRIPDGNELMPDVKALFDGLKRIEVQYRRKPGGWAMDEVASLALQEASRAGSCLVIVNTKGSAQTIHRLCKEQSNIPAYHLSTNMCPAHRKSILAEVIARLANQEPTLCISTQLIEAGVDVDFGSVIRFTAGLDSIAQAAGRCNRNGLHDIGLVHVVNPRPEDENLGMLPDIRIGRDKAERVLNDYESDPDRFDENPIGPKAMAWYYQNYFFARATDMDYPVSADTIGHDDNLLNLLSTNSQTVAEFCRAKSIAPRIFLHQSFMTAAKAFKAIDAPTRGILVPFGAGGQEIIKAICAAYLPDKQYTLLRRAQQFTVNLFPQMLDRLVTAGVVHEVQEGTGILYLADARYYSTEQGLSETPEGQMEVFCV